MGKPLEMLLLIRNPVREDTMEAKTCTEGKQVPAGVSSPAGTDRGHCYEDLILRNVIQRRHRPAIEITLNTRENTNKEDKNDNVLN